MYPCINVTIDQTAFNDLYSQAPDSCFKAMALSSAIPHAGNWLNVVQSHAFEISLHDWESRMSSLLAGLELVEEGLCSTVRQAVTDIFKDHQVGCGGIVDRTNHHDCLQDALYSSVQSAALAPRREVPSLIPGSCSHPAGPASNTGCFCGINPSTAESSRGLYHPSHALSIGEERKVADHAKACHSWGPFLSQR